MEILEKGEITFVYRPRVEHALVHGMQDVRGFYLLLHPEGREAARRIVVGRKRLPAPGNSRHRFWACVDRAGTPAQATLDLEGGDYATVTRGIRHQAPARPAGNGRYALVRHEDHTHFTYALELPREPGPVQHAFGIGKHASYIIAVMNPQRPRDSGGRTARRIRPHFPEVLQWRFEARRFSPVDPPDFLDWEGAELVLIGSKGTERCAGLEHVVHTPDQVLEELRLPKTAVLRRPLVLGQWS